MPTTETADGTQGRAPEPETRMTALKRGTRFGRQFERSGSKDRSECSEALLARLAARALIHATALDDWRNGKRP